MNYTDILLLGILIFSFIVFIFDQFIITKFLFGKTYLSIPLYRQKINKIDGSIFILLIFIFLCKNIDINGICLTTFFLFLFEIISLYFIYIRYPKLLFKDKGFFYNWMFVNYSKITKINISENFFVNKFR